MPGLLIGLLVSQGLWAKTYGGTSDDYACSITQTTDGGFAVAGYSYSFGAGEWDFQVLKLNGGGGLIWAKTFGGTNNEVAYSIIQTTDGGFAVTGYTKSFGAGGADFLVLKLSSSGGLDWARAFGGTGTEEAHSIVQSADGGFAVAGKTNSFGAGDYDLLVLKISSAGAPEWARTFGGANADEAYSIAQTAEGGFAVTGYTRSFGAGGADFLVLKLSSSGGLDWARTFGGTDADRAHSIIRTTDGGFGVAGYSYSFGAGWEHFLVLRLDDSGNISWARTFGTMNWEEAYSMIQTNDGGFAIGGYTFYDYDDFLILRLDDSGNLMWARAFGGNYDEDAYSLAQAADGGFALAGETWTFDPLYCDFLILKVGPDGNYPGCVQNYSLTVNTVSPSVSAPSVGADCSPIVSSPTISVGTQSPTIKDVCVPSEVEEGICDSRSGIAWFSVPGGALFVSSGDMSIRIYAADGRLAYSGKLEKGQNRITLEAGVYLWMAADCGGTGAPAYPASFGKAVVR